MKYSFIIPVYGTEKYLAECIESVLAQTYDDFEVILVDDCSPDGCPAICDGFAASDSRIKVIHKQTNGGLGPARNTGLNSASGEYIIFVDSDDRISPEMLNVCDAMSDGSVDIFVFGIKCVYEDKKGNMSWIEDLPAPAACGNTLPDIFIALNTARIFPFAWNKIYRRSFLEANELKFEKTELIEDFLFNIAAFSAEPSVGVIPDMLYFYRRPAHETLVSGYSPRFFELCKRKYLLEKGFLETHDALNADNASFIAYSHIKHIISVAVRNRSEKAGLSVKQQMECISDMLKDPVTKQTLELFVPQGGKQKLIAENMKKGNAAFVYTLGAASDATQKKAMALFKKYIRK